MKKLSLAIESSCDDTSLALIQRDFDCIKDIIDFDRIKVIKSLISSQIELHRPYGGVVPELGAREHAKNIHILLDELLDNDYSKLEKLDEIFVTTNPGLISALRVGIETAKSLQSIIQKRFNKEIKLIEVNHLNGHLYSCFYNQDNLDNIFPHLHLLVSGGHTRLLLLKSLSDIKILGNTLDDAAGECLDKAGRMLGLPHPGGVAISKIAGIDNKNLIDLPVGMSKTKDLKFSFSGLKTAIRYKVQAKNFQNWRFEQKLEEVDLDKLLNKNLDTEYLKFIYETCLSTQSVVVSQLILKMKQATKLYKPKSLGLSGGVSANPLLRKKMSSLGLPTLLAPKELTGDNAVMIALAGIVTQS